MNKLEETSLHVGCSTFQIRKPEHLEAIKSLWSGVAVLRFL